MKGFAGGSAWAMAREVADGYVLVTDRSLRQMTHGQVDQLVFELERRLRDLRGEPRDLEDVRSVQGRNRRMQRITRSISVMRAVRAQRKPLT